MGGPGPCSRCAGPEEVAEGHAQRCRIGRVAGGTGVARGANTTGQEGVRSLLHGREKARPEQEQPPVEVVDDRAHEIEWDLFANLLAGRGPDLVERSFPGAAADDRQQLFGHKRGLAEAELVFQHDPWLVDPLAAAHVERPEGRRVREVREVRKEIAVWHERGTRQSPG